MQKPRTRKAGEASGTVQRGGSNTRKSTRNTCKSQRSRTTEEVNPASVYRGLERVGDVEPDAGRWSAVTPDGLVLGVFGSRREATRAVLEVAR